MPSFFTAALISIVSSRACPAAARFSIRSSTHFTGRPSILAAAQTTRSSRDSPAFCPKAPPMSGITTRNRSAGCFSRAASACRAACGACEAA